MPVFFGTAGLSADLTILKDPSLLFLTLGLIAIASFGKFGGAFMGGKLAGLNFRKSLALGTGMNARGSTEVIIATIGLSMGALSQNLFTMIVTMAVVTTMVMPPTLRWALSRLPMRKDEKQRLEREEMEEKGFVSKDGAAVAGSRRKRQCEVRNTYRRLDRRCRRNADDGHAHQEARRPARLRSRPPSKRPRRSARPSRNLQSAWSACKTRREIRHHARCNNDGREGGQARSRRRRGRKGLQPHGHRP